MSALSEFWFPRAPARRLATLRAVVGAFSVVYLLIAFPRFTEVAHLNRFEFKPVGVVSLLSEPLPQWLVSVLTLATLASAVAFMLGLLYRWTGPLFAVLLLWTTSYRSSWGMLFHTENLLVLHVLMLAVSPAADALSFDVRRRGTPFVPDSGHERYGWPIRVMAALTASTYLLAGVAKLKLSGFEWLDGELLRAQIAYDNLRKIELGSSYSPVGAWLVQHAWVFKPFAVVTVLVELGAPAALFGTRIALVWAIAAWGFHVGVAALMNIGFPYPLSFVAYLPLFPVERWSETAVGRRIANAWRSRARVTPTPPVASATGRESAPRSPS